MAFGHLPFWRCVSPEQIKRIIYSQSVGSSGSWPQNNNEQYMYDSCGFSFAWCLYFFWVSLNSHFSNPLSLSGFIFFLPFFGVTFIPLATDWRWKFVNLRFIWSFYEKNNGYEIRRSVAPSDPLVLLYNCAAYNIICQMWLANYGHGRGRGRGPCPRFAFNSTLR